MKNSKWIGACGVILMVIAAYLPWITIISKNISISGMDSTGTNFGKPALMNLIVSGISTLLLLYPSIMAKRANLFFGAFNIAWCIRNYVIVSMCRGGECPEKRVGLYLFILGACILMIATLFPDFKISSKLDDQPDTTDTTGSTIQK